MNEYGRRFSTEKGELSGGNIYYWIVDKVI
jgi:hypothetical protein